MILRRGPQFDKSGFQADVISVLQGNNSFQYYNTRLIRRSVDVTVKSPTHEYYDICHNNGSWNAPESFLFIDDIGDGGSKSDKYERDIRLLSKGLEDEPTNGRYMFYLANSYFDIANYEMALVNYQRLVANGSWIEEVFYSYYRMGTCFLKLNKDSEALNAWMMGYQVLPSRAETLYEIIRYYRYRGKSKLCELFWNTAKKIKYPKDCHLFIHKDIYQYRLLEEYCIFCYYLNQRNVSREMFYLMNTVPQGEIYSLFNNYKFYQPILIPIESINIGKMFSEFNAEVFGKNYSFIASTPSIVSMDNEFIVNVRFVNYRINSDGSYPWYDHIVTLNKKLVFDHLLRLKSTTDVVDLNLTDRHYVGTEDIKLMNYNNEIYYTGTSLHKNGNLGIVGGKYFNNLSPDEYKYRDQCDCEKNWVYIPGNSLRMIYKWFPLTYGSLVGNELICMETKEMPQLFSLARGSTNGCQFRNEIWFLVHYVHHNGGEPRHYYHSFVVFDLEMNLKRYSRPIKFTSGEIEYACGLAVEARRVIITHSVWDRESHIKVYSKDMIEELFTDLFVPQYE
jgi:hypothetical protein